MTTVTIGREGCEWVFEARGHAGESSVCTACSTIAQMLYGALLRAGVPTEIAQGDGVYCIRAKATDKEHAAQWLFFEAMTGFEMLAGTYPQNVRIQHDQNFSAVGEI